MLRLSKQWWGEKQLLKDYRSKKQKGKFLEKLLQKGWSLTTGSFLVEQTQSWRKKKSCLWNISAFILHAGRICLLTCWVGLPVVCEKGWFHTIVHGSINCKSFPSGLMIPKNLCFSHLLNIKWLLVMWVVPSTPVKAVGFAPAPMLGFLQGVPF